MTASLEREGAGTPQTSRQPMSASLAASAGGPADGLILKMRGICHRYAGDGAAIGASTRATRRAERINRVIDAEAVIRQEALVLDHVDLDLAAGERCAVMGPSGSGKSTLLHIAAGLEPALGGHVLWAGETVTGLREPRRTRLRRRFTGVVFQDFHLLAALSALENVELALALARPEWSGRDRRDRAMRLLTSMGLGARQVAAAPETLSGGERQRVAIARALAHEPRLVLADEPTGRLDRANGERVLDDLSAGVVESGAALLVVTHDAAIATKLTEPVSLGAPRGRILHLQDGRWVGSTDAVHQGQMCGKVQ
ncbi:MAG: ABC transporter ATP-binding protein [Thioalkalivibrionaceae bacterium]